MIDVEIIQIFPSQMLFLYINAQQDKFITNH